jgi:hypothetical protein
LPGRSSGTIGHLQTNKAKLAVGLFDRIHSLDSIRLAHELERHALEAGRRVRCLVQVNVGGEEQKNGASESEVRPLLEPQVDAPLGRRIDGHPAVPFDPEAVRPFFRLRGSGTNWR